MPEASGRSDIAAEETVEVVFQPYGKRVRAQKGATLLEASQLAGLDIRSVCGGKGECGKCRVTINKGQVSVSSFHDEKFLTPQELSEGYHIACKTRLLSDVEVGIPPETRIEKQQILTQAVISKIELNPKAIKLFLEPSLLGEGEINSQNVIKLIQSKYSLSPQIEDYALRNSAILSKTHQGVTVTLTRENGGLKVINVEAGNTSHRSYGLAIDIGTTKVVEYLVNLNDGAIIDVVSDYNAQLLYGEELISRIDYASSKKDGLVKLQKAVVDTINRLISNLASRNKLEIHEIIDVCAAGNTVMAYLLAGLDPSPLNYKSTVVSRDPIKAKTGEFGITANANAEIYCMPNVSRWLGGDAVADIIASGILESPEISLLIDMGTNGEVILGSEGWIFSTSCAAGPAFEGYEIRFGMRSVEGAIERVKIDRESLKSTYHVIGGPTMKPRGICGSGLIDLTSEMFKAGILSSSGKIQRKAGSPLIREGLDGLEYVVAPAEETNIRKDIVITDRDLYKFLDSKAATCGAIIVLIKKAGIEISEVKNLYLAGAFGNYVNMDSAFTIGLFPEFPNARVAALGNGSIAGAYLALLSTKKRENAEKIAKITTYWDLIDDPDFTDEYYEALNIPGNPKFFPTYAKKT